MDFKDIIVIGIIVLIIGSALFYVIKAKKRGQKCIGCPYACSCNSKNNQKQGGCQGSNCSSDKR